MLNITETALCREIFCKLDDIANAEYRLECAMRVFQMVTDVMPINTPPDWEKGLSGAETLLYDATVELRQKVDEATEFLRRMTDGRSESHGN